MKYKVTNINPPANERIFEADSFEYEEGTGAVAFKDSSGRLVARVYNVNVEPADSDA